MGVDSVYFSCNVNTTVTKKQEKIMWKKDESVGGILLSANYHDVLV